MFLFGWYTQRGKMHGRLLFGWYFPLIKKCTMCVCMCNYVCIYNVHTCMCVCLYDLYVCVLSVCRYACMYECMYVCTCVRMHTHTHTHTQRFGGSGQSGIPSIKIGRAMALVSFVFAFYRFLDSSTHERLLSSHTMPHQLRAILLNKCMRKRQNDLGANHVSLQAMRVSRHTCRTCWQCFAKGIWRHCQRYLTSLPRSARWQPCILSLVSNMFPSHAPCVDPYEYARMCYSCTPTVSLFCIPTVCISIFVSLRLYLCSCMYHTSSSACSIVVISMPRGTCETYMIMC